MRERVQRFRWDLKEVLISFDKYQPEVQEQ